MRKRPTDRTARFYEINNHLDQAIKQMALELKTSHKGIMEMSFYFFCDDWISKHPNTATSQLLSKYLDKFDGER